MPGALPALPPPRGQQSCPPYLLHFILTIGYKLHCCHFFGSAILVVMMTSIIKRHDDVNVIARMNFRENINHSRPVKWFPLRNKDTGFQFVFPWTHSPISECRMACTGAHPLRLKFSLQFFVNFWCIFVKIFSMLHTRQRDRRNKQQKAQKSTQETLCISRFEKRIAKNAHVLFSCKNNQKATFHP